jgi:hypothetical protein
VLLLFVLPALLRLCTSCRINKLPQHLCLPALQRLQLLLCLGLWLRQRLQVGTQLSTINNLTAGHLLLLLWVLPVGNGTTLTSCCTAVATQPRCMLPLLLHAACCIPLLLLLSWRRHIHC